MNKKTIDRNSKVTLHFSLTLADGSPVDSTVDGEPMSFTMGDGEMLPAFEGVMLGLGIGDKQQVSLDPRETFGFPDEENRHWMERDVFDRSTEIQEGLILEFSTPAGDNIPGLLLEVKDEKILVDFNHPLAGHEVIFAVEIINIE